MEIAIIRLLQSYNNKIVTKIIGVEFSKWEERRETYVVYIMQFFCLAKNHFAKLSIP
jgi:hypothetical protein